MYNTSILTSGNMSFSVRISHVYLTIDNRGDRYRRGIKPLVNIILWLQYIVGIGTRDTKYDLILMINVYQMSNVQPWRRPQNKK